MQGTGIVGEKAERLECKEMGTLSRKEMTSVDGGPS